MIRILAKKGWILGAFLLFSTSGIALEEKNDEFNQNLTKKTEEIFNQKNGWGKHFLFLHKQSIKAQEQSNIGIINIIDEEGYPVGLPIHFEYMNDKFYFSSNALSKKNENLSKNKKVSLLIYYKSLDQSTVLIKGEAVLTKASYEFKSLNKSQKQIIYEIDPQEVDISYLDRGDQDQLGIHRPIYIYKKQNEKFIQFKRSILIEKALDDLEENMKNVNKQPLSDILSQKNKM